MTMSKQTSRVRAAVVAAAATTMVLVAGAATAKEGASSLGKKRVKVDPVAAPCVEKGTYTAWAGLLLSPWIVTTPNGVKWKFAFDDKGHAIYDLGAGSVTGIYTQPLTVYTPKVELIFTINTTDGYIQPLSDCTMLVNTNIGVLHFQRT